MFESITNFAKQLTNSFGPIISSIIVLCIIYAVCMATYNFVDEVIYHWKRWKRSRRRAKGEFANSNADEENEFEED